MNKVDKPIRVAHIIGKLNAAGVEAVVNNYYRNINHDNIQFDYYIDADSNCKPPQELIDMGARYIVIPPYQHLFKHLSCLIKHFKENDYKIVHSGMNTLAVFSLFAAWIAKVPVRINHNHSTASKGETKRNIMKYALRPFAKLFATDYCACSNYAGEWLFGKKSMVNGEVTVFNNAVDLNRFKLDDEARKTIRKELGIEDKLVIGHIGRFCYQKNHDFLIDIFNEVHKQNPNSVLILVGIGELTDAIKAKVSELGLKDCVKFLGVRTDVDKLYQAMDVFVLPSHYEGLPVVGVEAQASGLPCVFSDAMTAETKMTETTQMFSLSLSAKDWASKVIKAAGTPRRDTSSEIRKAGFDIANEGKKLEEFYLKRI
jgi:glycosyltransferase EpsF